MESADLDLACAWALVDGLVAGGVRHACVSPGSRSTSLALACARHPDLTVHVHLDERSSAFFAGGLARASRSIVALVCTSGTAAAEFLPGVVEASQSRTPLVVLTADRPPRLRNTGANQTIDQVGLYGGYVRANLDLPVPEAQGQEAWWRQAAREALEAARSDPVGPVHVNCPFEEPLTPSPGVELPPPTGEHLDLPRRPDAELTSDEADRLAALVDGARGAVVAGGWPDELDRPSIAWTDRLGWPVIAEPTSTLRRPGDSLTAGQALLGDATWVEARRPEVVLQIGASPTTRATHGFLASAERLVVADRWHLDPDPDRGATWRLAVDPDALTTALGATRPQPAPSGWAASWHDGDARARSAMDGFFDAIDEPFEPRIARDVAASIHEGGTLLVGNSTPVRDLDLAMAPRTGLRVMANRGASGIDGLVATALGIASVEPTDDSSASERGPTIALIGDLSFVHDAGSLLWAGRSQTDLVVVVVDNGGGEVFSLLPQRGLPEHRELFTTPHEVDIESLCAAARVGHARIDEAAALIPAIETAVGAGGVRVVQVIVDPARALSLRGKLRTALDDVLH
jgi:2-succinyl-5-enolpyruvyl-6-hydroxy-3-cyclohexene-1-carboxylate synthase